MFSAIIGALFVTALLFAIQSTQVKASGGFLPATIATTSVALVNTTASTIIATSSCTARIISTTGVSGITLTFTDNQGAVPTSITGFYQAASTTVAYDSALYGCGAVKAFSGIAQTITVSDAR